MGRTLIIIGIVLIVVGLIIIIFPKINLFKLPGDIVFEKKNVRFYFPIVTSILLSIILSLIFYFINKGK